MGFFLEVATRGLLMHLGWRQIRQELCLYHSRLMKFTDIEHCTDDNYSVGIVDTTGEYYIAIPVSNRQVDYEEYYRISSSERDKIMTDRAYGREFAERCRKRRMDNRLIEKPGRDRGIPR